MSFDSKDFDYFGNKETVTDISLITNNRPEADHSIEQYLMTKESYIRQLYALNKYFKQGKKIFMVGDDDQFSPSFIKYLNLDVELIEIDSRVIKAIKHTCTKLNLKTPEIYELDISKNYKKLITDTNDFDYFYINPPYNSKNEAYGIKVWTSICLSKLKIGGSGVVVLPIINYLDWSLNNMRILQEFLAMNGSVITSIDNNLHYYEDLPDDGLHSSNIYIKKIGPSQNLIENVTNNLYR